MRFSVGKRKQAEGLRLKEKWGRGRTVNSNFTVKNEKNKSTFCYMQPHLYIMIMTVHVSQWHLQTCMISLLQVSSPAVQLFLFSSGRLKHGDTSFGSLWALGCVFMCRNMCVLMCVCVCVCTSFHICSSAVPAKCLVIFVSSFPGKSFWCLFCLWRNGDKAKSSPWLGK